MKSRQAAENRVRNCQAAEPRNRSDRVILHCMVRVSKQAHYARKHSPAGSGPTDSSKGKGGCPADAPIFIS
jgi:hypothetical protein